ncbi:MAG: hypothetical protein MHM6MM_007071, partial [Cercozoa sp. M6MM]
FFARFPNLVELPREFDFTDNELALKKQLRHLEHKAARSNDFKVLEERDHARQELRDSREATFIGMEVGSWRALRRKLQLMANDSDEEDNEMFDQTSLRKKRHEKRLAQAKERIAQLDEETEGIVEADTSVEKAFTHVAQSRFASFKTSADKSKQNVQVPQKPSAGLSHYLSRVNRSGGVSRAEIAYHDQLHTMDEAMLHEQQQQMEALKQQQQQAQQQEDEDEDEEDSVDPSFLTDMRKRLLGGPKVSPDAKRQRTT